MTQKLRIGLIGATGKLGRAIVQYVNSFSSAIDCEIGAAFSRQDPPRSSTDVDLFIDVSSACALSDNLQVALESQKPIVIGTTGHRDLDLMKKAARSIPVLYSSNFSVGMALMRQAATLLAEKFDHSGSVDLIETHSASKKDSPSGSALMLIQSIEKFYPGKVHIESIRNETVMGGEHVLHFCLGEERLTLVHKALNREPFSRGAIAAARFLMLQSPGFFEQ